MLLLLFLCFLSTVRSSYDVYSDLITDSTQITRLSLGVSSDKKVYALEKNSKDSSHSLKIYNSNSLSHTIQNIASYRLNIVGWVYPRLN